MKSLKPLILIGGGGHCKSIIETAESAGYDILGVLDFPEDLGKPILSAKVIGTDDDIQSYVGKAEFIISVGFIKSPTTRIRLYDTIKAVGGKLATIIASTAYVSKHTTIGEGTVVMHHTFVNADVKIAENVIINDFANIEHDAQIGAHTHISTGAMVNGAARIGKQCFIGSQAMISNGVHICDNVIVGAGAVVVKDIVEPGIYVGNPAKNSRW